MMKHACSTLRLAHASKILLLAAVIGLSVSPAWAEDKKAAAATTPAVESHLGKIAVVDVQYLVSNSSAGKSIRTQLEKQRNSYKTQIEKQESDLRAQEKQLVEKQAKLSKDELMAERKKFQEKVIAAQKSVQQRRIAFDKAYTNAMSKLREHVVKIVAEMSGKRGISLVMSREDLVLVDQRLDMTEDVLKALNAKVTSIPVSVN